jgi:hypothetical protein
VSQALGHVHLLVCRKSIPSYLIPAPWGFSLLNWRLKKIGKESSSKAEVLAMLSGHISKAALIAAIEAAAAAAVEQLKLHAEDSTKAAPKKGAGKKSKKKRKSKSKEMTPATVVPHDNSDSHD